MYVLSETGKLTVLRAGREWEIVAQNDLEDTCFATPAIGDSRLYVSGAGDDVCVWEVV